MDLAVFLKKQYNILWAHLFRREMAEEKVDEKKEIENQLENDSFIDSQPLYKWSSPEFVKKERKKSWYLAVILVSSVMVFMLYFINKGGAFFALLACLFLLFFSKQKPKIAECSVYEKGVLVDNRVYHYKDFKSFSLDLEPALPRMRLELSGRFGGDVILPLQNAPEREIYRIISSKLPEVNDRSSDIIDLINKYL